nr:MAG TPA: prohead protease [Caudoviricetes sp.]
MKIKNVLIDERENVITVGDLVRNSAGDNAPKSYRVVYAHVDEVNDNKLQLTANSIQTTRDRYPVLVEHADNRVEDVIGYITTDGKPNEAGEFVGEITFYDTTPQAQHAEQLWRDGVINELSVSYYIKDYDVMDDGDYVRVNSAILKEVSLVSVGADRHTGEVSNTETGSADVTPTVTTENGEAPADVTATVTTDETETGETENGEVPADVTATVTTDETETEEETGETENGEVPADVTATVTTDETETDKEDELEKLRLNVLRSALFI